MTGVEALIRWQHAELGYISPGLFIPLAEHIGTISELGDWVLKTAIDQCRCWVDQGLGPAFRMAVNVSPRQLTQGGFNQRVISLLQELNSPPNFWNWN